MKVKVNKAWCKGCGICVEFCPKNVLALDHHEKIEIVNPDDKIKISKLQVTET